LTRPAWIQRRSITGLDRGVEGNVEQDYQRSLMLPEALNENVLLAGAMNDRPLEPQHGFPLRLVVPGWCGMTHVKWFRSIEVLDHAFDGYQQTRAYRYSQARDETLLPSNRPQRRPAAGPAILDCPRHGQPHGAPCPGAGPMSA